MVNRRERSFTNLTTTLIGIFGVTVLAGGLVFGQNFSAAISGVVRDATGAVLPGVNVTARHTESGLTRTVQSNETGDYRMPSLPVGAYEVTAELSGFKQQLRRGRFLPKSSESCTAHHGRQYTASSFEDRRSPRSEAVCRTGSCRDPVLAD